MKVLTIPILLFFLLTAIHAQQHDLNFYLEQAKINSPLIKKNNNGNKIVELDLKQIRSILSKPEINVESSVLLAPIVTHDNNSNRFEFVSDGAGDYTGYDLAFTDGGQYQAGISVKQPLLTGSAFRTYSNKADISQQINDNNIELTCHELEQLVGYQYILCLKAKAQTENSQLLLDQVDEQLTIMQRLVENAIYKQTDFMILQIEQRDFEADYKSFQAEYINNLYDLNLICGINDIALIDIQQINFKLKPDTIVHSKFLMAYKLDSLNMLAEQSIYMQKYKPQLYLFANTGLNAVYMPAFNRFGFSAGITFSWNIFDGHQRGVQQQKTNINLNTLVFEKQNFITQTDIQRRKILNQIQALEQRENIINEQINQYDILLNAYLTQLSQGEISVMDLKNLLKDFARKKQELVLVEMERQTLINSYNYWYY